MEKDIEKLFNGKRKKMSFEEIGKELGVSKQMAYKIYQNAIKKIKDNFELKYDRDGDIIGIVEKEKREKQKDTKRKKYVRKFKRGDKWIYIYDKRR